ncbi:MAG: class IV adenylate cyclase [Planctomycetota bacterium]|nr:class IV adenylate cyclase [Planctomycetota bacterium]
MQNVEFKAELRDLEVARAVCRSIGALHVATLDQSDTYYRIGDGRLKRRTTEGEPTEWIFYNRDDLARARISNYRIYTEEEALAHFGTAPLPVWVVVRKRRELWMTGAVRIHLDSVEDLGDFLEFEALVSRRQNVARCHEQIKRLRTAFAPVLGEPISRSYSDLLAAEAA